MQMHVHQAGSHCITPKRLRGKPPLLQQLVPHALTFINYLPRCSYHLLYQDGYLKGYKQNSRSKYMNLIQNIAENRLICASGPVRDTHSDTFIRCKKLNDKILFFIFRSMTIVSGQRG